MVMRELERQIDEHHNKDVHQSESPEKEQSRDLRIVLGSQ